MNMQGYVDIYINPKGTPGCDAYDDTKKYPQLNVIVKIDGVQYRSGCYLRTDRESGQPILDSNGFQPYAGKLELKQGQQPQAPTQQDVYQQQAAPQAPQGGGCPF
jgi:hypothetical protein